MLRGLVEGRRLEHFLGDACLAAPRNKKEHHIGMVDDSQRDGQSLPDTVGSKPGRHPLSLLFESVGPRKQGCRVAVRTKTEQDQIKTRPSTGRWFERPAHGALVLSGCELRIAF